MKLTFQIKQKKRRRQAKILIAQLSTFHEEVFMKNFVFIFATLFICIVTGETLYAQIPRTLSYQGVLTDAAGKPRPNPSYQFTFRLYDVATGGTALWTEQKTLSVNNGLFATALGDQVAFGAAVKFDRQYWLGIQVGNEPELSPRIALTSVGYSMNAVRADTADIALLGTARIISAEELELGGPTSTFPTLRFKNNKGSDHYFQPGPSGSFYLYDKRVDKYRIYISETGFVTIGGSDVTSALNVRSIGQYDPSLGGGWGDFSVSDGIYGLAIGVANGGAGAGDVRIWTKGGTQKLRIGTASNSNVLAVSNEGAQINGRTITNVLEITGGSDLAEPFPTSETENLAFGAVVVIDEDNPGHLKLSRKAYDKGVAGIVSGAGGINPGLTLRQEGVMEAGQLVALTGKVYALATSANGPIKPGDRLTTSALPGHCMKATDSSLCDGAVIGKAMSSLETGEGLVLVLVNLQ
jgi:hypothetical protein